MKISVIVPSRLQVNPISDERRLYLDRSLMTVKRQTIDVDTEITVGLDYDRRFRAIDRIFNPSNSRQRAKGLPDRFSDVTVAFPGKSSPQNQAAAVNAAVSASTGDVLAFLEDDDIWSPVKLEVQVPLLDRYDMVTCTQREIDDTPEGGFVRYNNFATPSGWVMTRETWNRVGGFNEEFKYHLDNDFLGRANKLGLRRAHVVHEGAEGEWLENVKRRSDLVSHPLTTDPLVTKQVNSSGGMAEIGNNCDALELSVREHDRMIVAYGEVPW